MTVEELAKQNSTDGWETITKWGHGLPLGTVVNSSPDQVISKMRISVVSWEQNKRADFQIRSAPTL